jgi:hypothetical protein
LKTQLFVLLILVEKTNHAKGFPARVESLLAYYGI